LYGFDVTYLERCRVARLRRWPDRTGTAALRLERGDLYAWREGLPPTPGEIVVSLLAEPRPIFIAPNRIWWVPRLEQLLERLELIQRRDAPALSAREARGRIAIQLVDRVRERDEPWVETALSLVMEREGSAA
jgi:hypothetical protein